MKLLAPLVIRKDLSVPGDYLSVAYTRDLGGEGTPEMARQTPTSVEFRLDVGRCELFKPAERERILGHPELRHDRRGVVRVQCSEFQTRRRNVEGARYHLAHLIRQALDGRIEPPAGPPVTPRPRRGRKGLIKTRDASE